MALYMRYYRFKVWCEQAVSGIIFPPDRKKVSTELYLHMEDHYDDLIEQGIPPETAEKQVVSAMGDARELAPLLAAVHRPFWGYFLHTTRELLVIALCVALIFLGRFISDKPFSQPYYDKHGSFELENYGPESGRILLSYSEPGCSFESDGYTFTVTKAAFWTPAESETGIHYFHILAEQFNPRPWAASPRIIYWFWAEDSLGNHYCSRGNKLHTEFNDAIVLGNCSHTSPLTYTYELWISSETLAGAEWIDLHYDRDGRDCVLRIDLTGGDAA